MIRKLLIVLLMTCCYATKASWETLNTGVSANINGVAFKDNFGIIATNKGLFFTLNGGASPSDWTFIHPDSTSQPSNSAIYSATVFSDVVIDLTTKDRIYACGQDTVNKRAVIIDVNVNHPTYYYISQKSYGTVNSKFNKVHAKNGYVLAGGDSGKLFYSQYSSNSGYLPFPKADDIVDVEFGLDILITTTKGIYEVKSLNSNLSIWDSIVGLNNVIASDSQTGVEINVIENDKYSIYRLFDLKHEITNYPGGVLNARDVYDDCVATNHGLYRNTKDQILEYIPLSEGKALNAIARDVDIYSVYYTGGDNGVLYKFSDPKDKTEPYGYLDFEPSCQGVGTQLSGSVGSSTSCDWYLDGDLISNDCSFGNYSFPDTGYHNLEVYLKSDIGYDTASHSFYIQAFPKKNLNFNVFDTLICKSGKVKLEVLSPEKDVQYRFHYLDDHFAPMPYSEGDGGATETTESSVITKSGYLTISSSAMRSHCGHNWNDSVYVTVQNTKANFRNSVINGYIGEKVKYFNSSNDWDHAKWELIGDNQVDYSVDSVIEGHHNKLGRDSIKLVVWTDENCYDSITKLGTNIVPVPTPPLCWAVTDSATDLTWSYTEAQNKAFYKGKKSVYRAGSFSNKKFESNYGISFSNSEPKGAFLNKYDLNGMLKWHTAFEDFGDGRVSAVHDIVEDSQENVFTSSYFMDDFVSNAEQVMPSVYKNENALTKFNNLGEIIDVIHFDSARVFNLEISLQDELFVSLAPLDRNTTVCRYTHKGVESILGYSNIKYGNKLFKYDSDLNLDWYVSINGASLSRSRVNSKGEIILVVSSEDDVEILKNGTLNKTITFSGFKKDYTFVIKLDGNGDYVWHSKLESSSIIDFDIDQNDGIYLGISFSFQTGNETSIVIDATGQKTINSRFAMPIVKLNDDGEFQWISGMEKHDDFSYNSFSCFGGKLYAIGTSIDSDGNLSFVGPSGNGAHVQRQHGLIIQCYGAKGEVEWIAPENNLDISSFGMIYPEMDIDDDGIFINGLMDNFPNVNGSSFNTQVSMCDGKEGAFMRIDPTCLDYIFPNRNINEINLCEGEYYKFPSGLEVDSMSQYITDTLKLTSSYNVDSLVITRAILKEVYTNNKTETICEGESYIAGDGTTYSNIKNDTTILEHLTSVYGCDSSLTVELIPHKFDYNIKLVNNTTFQIMASQNYSYTWYKCGSSSFLSFSSNYTPPDTDDYYVKMSKNGCVLNTACMSTLDNSSNLLDISSVVEVYPNPSNGELFVVSDVYEISTVKIYSLTGKLVHVEESYNNGIQLNIPSGTYMIEIEANGNVVRKKLMMR